MIASHAARKAALKTENFQWDIQTWNGASSLITRLERSGCHFAQG